MLSNNYTSVDVFTKELGYVRIEGYIQEDTKIVECIHLKIVQLVHTQGKEIVMTRDVDYDILTDEFRISLEELAYKEHIKRMKEQDD